MPLLNQSPLLTALGWSLLHSLWQMGICWMLYIAITRNGKKFSARQRYNIGCLLTAAGTICFLSTLIFLLLAGSDAGILRTFSFNSTYSSYYDKVIASISAAIPFLSTLYLLTAAYLLVRLTRLFLFTNKLYVSGVYKIDPSIRLYMEETKMVLGINKQIRIGLSELVSTPLTVGFWKPIILLPLAAINNLSIQQTETIILHELNHIRQNDYLVNILIATLDVLMFFNPFSRCLTTNLRNERENNCDDVVLQFKYNPRCYAEALLTLEKCRSVVPGNLAITAIGNSKKLLLQRIHRILYSSPISQPLNLKLLGLLFFLLGIGFVEFVNPKQEINQHDFVFPVAFDKGNKTVKEVEFTGAKYVVKSLTVVSLKKLQADQLPLHFVEPMATEYQFGEEEERPIGAFTVAAEYLNNMSDAMYEQPLSASYTIDEASSFSPSVSEDRGESAKSQSASLAAPFLPTNSFNYQYFQDTTLPKQQVNSSECLREVEELQKVILKLEQMDFGNFDKEIEMLKQELVRVTNQLKKAVQEKDWKIVEQDLRAKYKASQLELSAQQAYLKQLGASKYLAEKQVQSKNEAEKQKQILLNRLMENKTLLESEKENTRAKVKKVVVI